MVGLLPEAADRVEVALAVAALAFHLGAPQGFVPGVFCRYRRSSSRLVVLVQTLGKELQLPRSQVVEAGLHDVVAVLIRVHLRKNHLYRLRSLGQTSLSFVKIVKVNYIGACF